MYQGILVKLSDHDDVWVHDITVGIIELLSAWCDEDPSFSDRHGCPIIEN